MMIGKTVFEQYTPKEGAYKDVILQVRNLSNHKLKDISFDVRETGILLASEFKAGVSSRAMGYEFDALVISLLGGVSISGGFGSGLGMFVGAVILSVMTSMATGLLLSPDWQFTLKGVVTFLAILAQRFALDHRKG